MTATRVRIVVTTTATASIFIKRLCSNFQVKKGGSSRCLCALCDSVRKLRYGIKFQHRVTEDSETLRRATLPDLKIVVHMLSCQDLTTKTLTSIVMSYWS